MRVDQLWLHPVKSMIGTPVPEVELGPLGIVGDRHWAVRDLERGGIRGAKHLGALMTLAARFPDRVPGPAIVTFPDGTTRRTDDPDLAERISAHVGRRVAVEGLAPVDDVDRHRRGEPYEDDLMSELRAVFGRDDDSELPDLTGMPPEIFELETPVGTHHDAFPLLLLTSAALRALTAALPESAIDVRRFRPSVLIDADDLDGHPEREWVGRRLRLGDAEVRVTIPCPRCVMVTREVDVATPQDRRILRHIVDDLDHAVGVYAEVVSGGTVRTGDSVEVLED